jgi:hypothetical protein
MQPCKKGEQQRQSNNCGRPPAGTGAHALRSGVGRQQPGHPAELRGCGYTAAQTAPSTGVRGVRYGCGRAGPRGKPADAAQQEEGGEGEGFGRRDTMRRSRPRVWVLRFAQQERKRRGGRTWWVLVAGKTPSTWRRAAAAGAPPPETDSAQTRTRGTGERERESSMTGNKRAGRGYDLMGH